MKLGALMIKQAQEGGGNLEATNRRAADRLRRRLQGGRSADTEARGAQNGGSAGGGPTDWLENIGGILGQLMDKIMSSEMGRSIVSMIRPELAQAWQNKQTAEQAAYTPPEVVRPGQLTAPSADDPRHGETQQSLQQDAAAPEGQAQYAGMKDLPTYANAQDRFGNFYHQTEDGLVYRRVAGEDGAVQWTYMPQLSRPTVPEGEDRAAQWGEYYVNKLMNSRRYKELMGRDPQLAEEYLAREKPRMLRMGANRAQQELQSQGAKDLGLSSLDPAALRQAAGGADSRVMFDKSGVPYRLDEKGQPVRMSTKELWRAQKMQTEEGRQEMAQRDAAAAKRQRQLADPDYQARAMRMYESAGKTNYPGWVNSRDPDVLANKVTQDRAAAAPVGTRYDPKAETARARTAITAAQPAQPITQPITQPATSRTAKATPQTHTVTAPGGYKRPLTAVERQSKIGAALRQISDEPLEKEAAPAHFRSRGRRRSFKNKTRGGLGSLIGRHDPKPAYRPITSNNRQHLFSAPFRPQIRSGGYDVTGRTGLPGGHRFGKAKNISLHQAFGSSKTPSFGQLLGGA